MNKEKPGVQQGRGTISILDSRSHEKGDRGSNQNRATQVNQRDIKSFPKIRIQQKQPFAKKIKSLNAAAGSPERKPGRTRLPRMNWIFGSSYKTWDRYLPSRCQSLQEGEGDKCKDLEGTDVAFILY